MAHMGSGWRLPKGSSSRITISPSKCSRSLRLVKGYSDTHARGLSKFNRVLSAAPMLTSPPDGAGLLDRLVRAALADEDGTILDGALRTLSNLQATTASSTTV